MTFSALLRDAARPLPARAQVLIKELRARLRDDDWAGPIASLRRREQNEIDGTIARAKAVGGKRRILVFALQQSPPWLEVSYGLAAALALRGHDVVAVLCDGVMPLCEMNLGPKDRPPCDVCAGWLSRYADAMGIKSTRLSDLVMAEDRLAAERAVSERIPSHRLQFDVDGIPIGRFAYRELQRHQRGFVLDPSSHPDYQAWLVAGLLAVKCAGRLLDGGPDIVVASSGRTLLSATLMHAARARGVRMVTWDTEPAHPDGLIFSHNEAAAERPLDDVWREVRDEPLTEAEDAALDAYLSRWSRSEDTPFAYNPMPVSDSASIREMLGLRPGARLLAAFTNTAWDMKAVDRDAGFDSMFHWVFTLVEHAAARPELDLVIRAHPAEVLGTPDQHSRTPIVAETLRRFPQMPSNVKLVAPESPIDSYALAAMASAPMVYSSRIGLEIAVAGHRVWVAGEVTYRGKGFTHDVRSAPDMLEGLSRIGSDDGRLTTEERARARRFAYLWFFRFTTRVPLLRPPSRRFALESFRSLGPAGDPVIDGICDAIVSQRPFLNLSR